MKLRRYTCQTVRNMLPLHAGRDLDPSHVGAVDEHLESCLPCFREFRELAAMRARLGVLAEEPLPAGALDGFTEEVMARIEIREPGPAAEAPRPGRTLRIWRAWPRMAAAAALLIVAFSAWQLVDIDDPGVPSGTRLGDRGPTDGTVVSTPRPNDASAVQSGAFFLIVPGQGVVPMTPGDLDLYRVGGAPALEHAVRARLPLAAQPAIQDESEPAGKSGELPPSESRRR